MSFLYLCDAPITLGAIYSSFWHRFRVLHVKHFRLRCPVCVWHKQLNVCFKLWQLFALRHVALLRGPPLPSANREQHHTGGAEAPKCMTAVPNRMLLPLNAAITHCVPHARLAL